MVSRAVQIGNAATARVIVAADDKGKAKRQSVIVAAESELGAVNIAIKGGSDTSSKDHTLNSTPSNPHPQLCTMNATLAIHSPKFPTH